MLLLVIYLEARINIYVLVDVDAIAIGQLKGVLQNRTAFLLLSVTNRQIPCLFAEQQVGSRIIQTLTNRVRVRLLDLSRGVHLFRHLLDVAAEGFCGGGRGIIIPHHAQRIVQDQQLPELSL